MDVNQQDKDALQTELHRYADVDNQYRSIGGFWDVQGCHGNENEIQLVSKFTTSMFLAAPPPSLTKMLSGSNNNPSHYPAESRSRSPPSSDKRTYFYSSPESSWSSQNVNPPVKSMTSSFYTTTQSYLPEQSIRVLPPSLNSSSRQRYNSTSSGSTSSVDSGIVSFDISLPAESKLIIDSQNTSPQNTPPSTTTELFFENFIQDKKDTEFKDLETDHRYSSNYQMPANIDTPLHPEVIMFGHSARRPSFEIHATESNPITNRLHLEVPEYRRCSLQTDQSVGVAENQFSIDADINNNKYKDFGEDVLVDLLKKCTDFPERRKIRSALRHVRENQKEDTEDTDVQCSSVGSIDMLGPVQPAPRAVSVTSLKLSPSEPDPGEIVPVFTSTPRDPSTGNTDENDNSVITTGHVQPDTGLSQSVESQYHFDEIPYVSSSRQGIQLVFADSSDAKKAAGTGEKSAPKDTGGRSVSGEGKKVPVVRNSAQTSTKAAQNSTHSDKTKVRSAVTKTSTTPLTSSNTTARASVKLNLAQSREQQKVTAKPATDRAKSANTGSPRDKTKLSKTSTTVVPNTVVRKSSATSANTSQPSKRQTEGQRGSGDSKKKVSGVKITTCRARGEPAAVKSTSKSAVTSSVRTPQSAGVQSKSRPSSAKGTGQRRPKSATGTSDCVVVVGATENIIIPKIVISDETGSSETHGQIDEEKTVSSKNSQAQDKRKYYRKKQRPLSSPVPEGDDKNMAAAVSIETVSEVINKSDSPMKIDGVNSNESSQSGADLEKAFTDLLDNFEKLSGNDNLTDRDKFGNLIDSGIQSSLVKDLDINSNMSGEDLHSRYTRPEDTEMIDQTKQTVENEGNSFNEKVDNQTGSIGVSSMTEPMSILHSSQTSSIDQGIEVDRLGEVTIDEAEDGALTVTDVQELDQGKRKVSVTTKKQRTGSDGEYQDKETTITTTFESPSGTKYEEKDVIKTQRKLTHKGSIYVKRDAVKTKRAFSKTGEQRVEEDHMVETDNKSVSLGKSWGDKTLTTMVLSKPTKPDRTISAIQEETTADKTVDAAANSGQEGIPDIIQALADQQVTVGASVTLQCEGKGVPVPQVTWFSGGREVKETAYFKPSFDGKTAQLMITEAFPDDQQLYRCVFKNSHGSAETMCNLRVTAVKTEDVPSITQALEDIDVSPSDNTTLECRVTGLGEVFWHKEGTRLEESQKYEITLNSETGTAQLCIKDLTFADSGQYSCLVKNSAGEASSICQVSVSLTGCPPDILNPLFTCSATSGKSFKLLCRISGDPQPTVTWYHEGRELKESRTCKPSYVDNIARLELKPVTASDAGVYECEGKNSLGRASTSCHLTVKDESNATKSSVQLNIKAVSKSEAEEEDLEGIRRLETSQSLDIPSCNSTQDTKDIDIYSRGQVRSCTPPPQAVSCSPPPTEMMVRSCSPPRGKLGELSQGAAIQNVHRTPSSDTPSSVSSPSSPANGQTDTKTAKISAVNRLSNFFGNIMNTSSPPTSPSSYSRSPSQETQVEIKSSFVMKKRENGAPRLNRSSTEPLPNRGDLGGANKEDPGFDLSTIHRDIIMSAKIQEIDDEEKLHKMLDTTDSFEDRKLIRARLKQLREKAREEWERGRKEREAASVDVVKLRQQRAEEDKRRKMQTFQVRAETAGKDLEDKYLQQTQKDLQDRHRVADDEKQKKLDAYKQISKTGSGVSESRVTTSKQTVTDNGGKTTTTTTKTFTVQQAGFGGTQYGSPAPKADDVANNLANKIQTVTSPYTSGKITVRTETWNSQEGVVKKSETTQRWGANKPAGPKGAMAAFKQMDSLNPGAAKPNALVTVSLAKKAATTMRRNAVQIKAEILDFCKSNTAEYQNVQITNFSSCWNNGMAFCALIHHFYPDSFDYSALDPKARRKNFELAFDTAEKCADIAPLLDVEDMVKMKNPDWKCVFTYVQSFYRHLRTHPKCKQIVPPSQ